MATLSHADSSRMYSWWWDSHISPKNSKWLQENLTDMDVKVKAMIKLIEEDADSFARRAEMYYKKRPELMKLVEEFYRAYRALAERYDHATGVIRQAHRTMAEVFPNQVPLVLADDSPASSASEMDPCTPETTPPTRALFDPDSSQKDSLSHSHAVRRNGAYSEGRVRKGLDFHEAEENERSMQGKESHVTHNQSLSEPEVLGKFGKEIENLKDALAKLEAEKEAGLAQYQQSLERLSKLESEVSRAQEDFRGLNERANKAEGEVQTLWEALTILEAEKEASLLQYQQCLARIANLESVVSHAKEDVGELNERADKAEIEAQALKQEVAAIEYEKDAALDQYHQSLEMISTLENKLLLAEENARKLIERADKADREVENLKQALAKLTEEKEAAALQYQQCLETISSLEHEIISVREEARRLNGEIDSGVAKLNGAEEQCVLLKRSNQSLHTELESLALKMGSQSEELKEQQVEVGTLWACIQEERLRFMEAETAFQTLQHLHFQTQEELRSFASELQNRAQLLRDIETRNQSLQDNILKIKEKNKSLNELNIPSAMSIKDMQNEIFSLRETKGKLEEEAELRVDQRKALQQEIYFMKEELNEMNKKHQAMLDQVDAVGYSPECFESSVKELQDENSNLKETCKREISEKVLLLEKSEMTEHLLEKNALLEKLLSDLSSELEGARGKINALEESFQSLLGEKFTFVTEKASLITQLLVTTENLEKLSEKNTFLEISLSDAHDELEGLKARSKSLEDSCQLLENEKFDIINEKDALVSLGEITRQRLEVLEKRYRELEWKYSALEKDKYQEVNIKNEQYSLLQIEANNLFEMNEELQLKLRDRDQKEEVLTTTIENLHGKLFDMQKENISVLDETFTLSNLSLIFENVINEKSVELKELVEDMDKLHGVNGALEDKLSIMGWKLEGVQLENLHLKESLKNSEDELRTVTYFSDQLNCEIVNGKDLLSQKEIELYEAVCKLTATENEKSLLQEIVENLKREIDEVMMVRADQKMQILKLHEDNDYLSQENGCLSETNRELEVGLHKLHEEHVKTKSMKNMWEGEATNFFGELQISAVFQALLGEKIHELAEACKSLEDGITSKDMHIKLLKEKISTLEGENGLLKAQLAAYLPAIISLKNNISSLEKRTCLRAKHKKSHSGRAKDLTLASPQNVESCKEVNADHMVPDALSELQDLQNRIKAVEKAVVKRERLATQENLNANIKLEAAMKLTEELKFKCGSNQENVRPALEISEPENGLLMMKDIMLDQVSECSSSYEISRRQRVKAESPVLESWDTADVGGSIDLTVGKGKKIITAPMKRQKSKRLNSDILVEKELGVDTLEIARTFSQSRREMSKSKTLERLNSDVQKLTNLQITVQDLKRKVEITEKSKKVKTMVECDTLKGQLDEAEEAILKYFELNGKLKKSVEGRSFSTDSKSATESEETGNVKRRISDRARRVSEKIGRLQLEVQKIQLVLLKLDDENEKESKRRTRITETKRRVVLRDYLYGGVRSSPRRRKPVFCGCIQPPTRGD